MKIDYKSTQDLKKLKNYVQVDLALYEDDFLYNKITARIKIFKDGLLFYCGLLKKFDKKIIENKKRLKNQVNKALNDLFIDKITTINIDTDTIPVFIDILPNK